MARELFLAADALGGNACTDTPPPKPQRKRPARQGQSWTIDEDEKLRQAVASGKKAYLIAKAHERSRGAIVSRIEHLGLRPSIPDDLIYDANE